MQDQKDLELILCSRVPLVVIETAEEKRTLELLMRITDSQGKALYRWSVTDGLSRLSFGPQVVYDTAKLDDPEDVLRQIKTLNEAGVFVLCDFHHFMQSEPKNVRLLKDIAIGHDNVAHTIVFLSHSIRLPAELRNYSASFSLSLPGEEQIMAIIRDEARQWSNRNAGRRVKTDHAALQKMVANLQGVTTADVRRLVRDAITRDGCLTEDDLPEISKTKFQLMNLEGVLSYAYSTDSFADVGGLSNLKKWLNDRKPVFMGTQKSGLDAPRGMLILGVQGGGKSLAAKAVAGVWGIPLLRLDFGALYNKYFGETEKNLRESLNLADTMSPCVLWLDEIEKGIQQGGQGEGLSSRVLGTLLTWMAERKSRVFIVATSNDISAMPPELMRKGRMDEIFFVDLPEQEVRKEIFCIHLKKRALEPNGFNTDKLAQATAGFSGSEIEQAVVAAMYTAVARNEDLGFSHIEQEILNTSPLSVVMAERIHALRAWARNRTVPAD